MVDMGLIKELKEWEELQELTEFDGIYEEK
jgi:hypothetical protein